MNEKPEVVKNKKMVSIDQEIAHLESLYNQNSKALVEEMGILRKRVTSHKEPDSVEILDT